MCERRVNRVTLCGGFFQRFQPLRPAVRAAQKAVAAAQQGVAAAAETVEKIRRKA